MYYDIRHTKSVVIAAKQIVNHYGLNGRDLCTEIVAAWFHDMGYYLAGSGVMHEQKSAGLADTFLRERGVDKETILQVEKCVMAAKMPQHPVT